MRVENKEEAKAAKIRRSDLRKKQIAAFLLIFFLWTGLIAVDNSCQEMTGHRESLSLVVHKVSKDKIFISFLGKEALFNLSTSFTD